MNILLVEDNPTQSKLTSTILQRRGFEVDSAETLEQALKKLARPTFDAILLDLSLPDSDGINTFSRVHAITDIPVVVLSAQDDRDLALQAVRQGAQDYLIKGMLSTDSLIRCLQYSVERNRVENELRRGQERLRIIMDNSYDAFLSMNSDWEITGWNVQAQQTFGWTDKEAIGQSLDLIFPTHLKKQSLRSIEQQFLNNSNWNARTTRELLAIHKDGHDFPVEIGFFRIDAEPKPSYCAFLRDITKRIEYQEELEHLVQERTKSLTQKNEELRQFAKIASHDLQEPLKAVQGFVNLLEETANGNFDKDQKEFLGFIQDGTMRMQQLIKSVLIHSQIGNNSSENYTTDCNLVVEEVMADLAVSIKDTNTQFEVDWLPDINVEHSQMLQLFENLASNAIKYRSAKAPLIHFSAEESGDMWLFSVRDNGIGIDPEYKEKIFDMFSRLHGKTKYPGTGMGLAICKRIVTSHGGNIWVESKSGEGCIFLFTLPAIIAKTNAGAEK